MTNSENQFAEEAAEMGLELPEELKEGKSIIEQDKPEEEKPEKKAAEEEKKEEVVIAEDFSKDEKPSEKAELSTAEQEAISKGWKPAGELDEGKEFIPAEEFLRRESLFEKIASQKNELKDMKKAMKALADHVKNSELKAYEKAFHDLEAVKTEAVEAGDVAAYNEAADRQVSLERPVTNITESEQTVENLPPEVEEFKERNKNWFNRSTPENYEMYKFAEDVDQFISYKNGGQPLDPKDHLAQVEYYVKKQFPHRFEDAKANPRKEQHAAVASARKPTKAVERDFDTSTLSPEQKKLYKYADQVFKGGKKEYIEQLKELGAVKND